MNTATIVQKLWNYCNVLRDDGMSYGDYVEQLTYLLFLKMADERTKAPYNQTSPVLPGYDWESLRWRDGDVLFDHYRHVLERLGNEKGLLGLIFTKSQNKFQDPAKLRRLIVDLMAPKPGETVCDPACGTGGFLLATHDTVVKHNPNLTRDQRRKLKEKSFKGWELVQATPGCAP